MRHSPAMSEGRQVMLSPQLSTRRPSADPSGGISGAASYAPPSISGTTSMLSAVLQTQSPMTASRQTTSDHRPGLLSLPRTPHLSPRTSLVSNNTRIAGTSGASPSTAPLIEQFRKLIVGPSSVSNVAPTSTATAVPSSIVPLYPPVTLSPIITPRQSSASVPPNAEAQAMSPGRPLVQPLWIASPVRTIAPGNLEQQTDRLLDQLEGTLPLDATFDFDGVRKSNRGDEVGIRSSLKAHVARGNFQNSGSMFEEDLEGFRYKDGLEPDVSEISRRGTRRSSTVSTWETLPPESVWNGESSVSGGAGHGPNTIGFANQYTTNRAWEDSLGKNKKGENARSPKGSERRWNISSRAPFDRKGKLLDDCPEDEVGYVARAEVEYSFMDSLRLRANSPRLKNRRPAGKDAQGKSSRRRSGSRGSGGGSGSPRGTPRSPLGACRPQSGTPRSSLQSPAQKNNGAVTHQTDASRQGGYPAAEQPTASRGARGLVEI